MRRAILLIAAVLFLLSGCDRFDNEFEKHLTDFFNDFSDAVPTIQTVDQLEVFMSFYDSNYLNDALSYSDQRDWYEAMLGDYEWDLHVSIDRFTENELSKVQWTLSGTNDVNDTIFSWTFTDHVQSINGEYKFVGNGAAVAFQTVQENYMYDLMEAILASDFAALESYFTDDYYNNGMDRDSLFALFDDLSPALGVDDEVLDYDPFENLFVYELTENSTGNTLRVYETFTIIDGEYKFCGNGKDAPDTSKQKVLVELFTGTWCPNCPTSEEALHSLKEVYGDKFEYIEYHISDAYEGFYADNDELLDYYLGNIECPTAVFQGQLVMNGGISNESQYEMPLLDYMAIDARAFIDYADAIWDDTENTMDVSATITKDEYLSDTNLYLRYAIVEETAQAAISGEYYHQAVIWKGNIPFGDLMRQAGRTMYSLVINYEGDMPDDAVLYLWLQTMHPEYANDCKVYNVIEVPIQGI